MRSGTVCVAMCVVVGMACCVTLFLTEFLNSLNNTPVKVVSTSTVLILLLGITTVSSSAMIWVFIAGEFFA